MFVNLYDFAKEKNHRILDLGVSSVNGTPDFGLIHFKQALGLQPSLKLTCYYEI